jgi:hypothetical protein
MHSGWLTFKTVSEPVIYSDLLTCLDVFPGVQIQTMRHRIWLARMVEIAAGRRQNLARVFVNLIEMALNFCWQRGDLAIGDDAAAPSAKDEVARSEMAKSEDAFAFGWSVSHLNIRDHGALPYSALVGHYRTPAAAMKRQRTERTD